MKKFPVEMKKSPFFEGIEDTEEEKVLKGLDAHEMTYDKENYILHCGEQVKEMGMLVSGGLLIVQEDFWGNRNLLAGVTAGQLFAEAFACSPEFLFRIFLCAVKGGKHILCKYPIASVNPIYKNMSYCSHKFTVLYYRASAHAPDNSPCFV